MCVLTAAAGACLRILEVPSIHVCFHDAEQYQWNAHAPADSPFTYLAKKKKSPFTCRQPLCTLKIGWSR